MTDLENITLGLSRVEKLPQYFMQLNTSLTSLDLSSLTNVKQIDSYFLRGCTSLQTLNLSGFTNDKLTSINNIQFLGDISGLTIEVNSNNPPIALTNLLGTVGYTNTPIGSNTWSN